MFRKKKFIVLLVLVIIIIVSLAAFYIISQPPKETLSKEFKEKAITNLLGRKAQLDNTTPTGDAEYKGKYITFKYPAKALIYTYRENSTSSKSANLEDFSFDIKEPKMNFNMAVTKASFGLTVDDIPAVRLRIQRNYEYEKSTFTMDEHEGIVFFKKNNGVEKSGFLIKDGMTFTFNVNGGGEDEVNELFNSIASSVSF